MTGKLCGKAHYFLKPFQTYVIFHIAANKKTSMVHCLFSWATCYNYQNLYLSLKMDFVLVTSEDPYLILHYVAFHLGLHCFPKYLFSNSRQQRVKYMFL